VPLRALTLKMALPEAAPLKEELSPVAQHSKAYQPSILPMDSLRRSKDYRK
jgi:hypothetical protein